MSKAFAVVARHLASAIGAETPRPRLGTTLGLCTASQVLATFSVLGLSAITPTVSRSLGLDAAVIGVQVSLIYLSGIVASAFAGGLVHRLGAARLNQIALFCAGFGFLGLASANLVLMAAASLLIGVGYAFNNPCSSHMLNRLTAPGKRNLVFSIKQAGVPVGGMAAALVMPPLAATLGWRPALVAMALPIVALGIVFGLLRARWDDDQRPGGAWLHTIARNQRAIWSSRPLIAVSLLGMLYSAVQLSVSAYAVAMLVFDFGWSPLGAGQAAALLQVCGAVGRVLWGVVADRMRSALLVLAGLGFATGIGLVGLSLVPRDAGLPMLLLLGLIGLTAVGWNGVMLAETARLSQGRTGTLTGDVLVYTFIGVVLGPSMFAMLHHGAAASFSAVFAWFAVPAVVGGVLALLAALDGRRPGPERAG